MEHIHSIGAGRTQVAQIGYLPADPVKVIKGDVRMGFMGNGHQMQDGVCRSAKGHDSLDAIEESFFGKDLIRGKAFFNHLYDAFAAGTGKAPFSDATAGQVPIKGRVRPRTSAKALMVLAVPNMEQEPTVGSDAISILRSSS